MAAASAQLSGPSTMMVGTDDVFTLQLTLNARSSDVTIDVIVPEAQRDSVSITSVYVISAGSYSSINLPILICKYPCKLLVIY